MRSAPLYMLAAVAVVSLPTAAPSANPRTPAMKAALRNLVTAQESYWANHGTYTTDLAALGLFSGQRRGDSIWVQVINAGGRSWMGRAVHRGTRGKSCVVYVGVIADFPSPPVTEADSIRATDEGAPVCDAEG